MRKILAVAIMGMSVACAAVAEERETVIAGDMVHGGFIGPEMRLTTINGGTNLLMGGKGAWLINHTYYLGGGGWGSVKDIKDTNLTMRYGGLLLGILREPSQKFHYYFEVLVGAGTLSEPKQSHPHSGTVHASDSIFVVEPGVGGSVNLNQFATLNGGLSYRAVEGSDIAGINDSDFSGLALHVNVMFGKF